MKKNIKNARAEDTDYSVSKRLKARRLLIGMSKTILATKIGVSTQQIEKYESGINRLSSSKLYKCAKALDVPIDYFFKDSPGKFPIDVDTLNNNQNLHLMHAFNKINDDNLRIAIIRLTKALES